MNSRTALTASPFAERLRCVRRAYALQRAVCRRRHWSRPQAREWLCARLGLSERGWRDATHVQRVARVPSVVWVRVGALEADLSSPRTA